MISGILIFAQDGNLDKVWWVVISALVSQVVLGGLGLIGFVAVIRRVIDKEIPAKLASIDETMDRLDKHVADIGKELVQMRRDIDKHGYQIQGLEDFKKSQLEDTRGGSSTGGTARRR